MTFAIIIFLVSVLSLVYALKVARVHEFVGYAVVGETKNRGTHEGAAWTIYDPASNETRSVGRDGTVLYQYKLPRRTFVYVVSSDRIYYHDGKKVHWSASGARAALRRGELQDDFTMLTDMGSNPFEKNPRRKVRIRSARWDPITNALNTAQRAN